MELGFNALNAGSKAFWRIIFTSMLKVSISLELLSIVVNTAVKYAPPETFSICTWGKCIMAENCTMRILLKTYNVTMNEFCSFRWQFALLWQLHCAQWEWSRISVYHVRERSCQKEQSPQAYWKHTFSWFLFILLWILQPNLHNQKSIKSSHFKIASWLKSIDSKWKNIFSPKKTTLINF